MKNQSGVLAKRNLAFLLAIAVIISVAVAVMVGARPGKEKIVKPPEEIEDYLFWQANELTNLNLTGANGKTLGSDDLKGKWSFIFFGYTQCPDVCPLTMGILGKTFKLLEQDQSASQEIQGIFISVDPKRIRRSC
jgi:protein SCO1/2